MSISRSAIFNIYTSQLEFPNKICNNIITLYRCLFCSYIFINRESKLYNYWSIPADTKSPAGNGLVKALTHLRDRQVTKSHLYKVFLFLFFFLFCDIKEGWSVDFSFSIIFNISFSFLRWKEIETLAKKEKHALFPAPWRVRIEWMLQASLHSCARYRYAGA